jgi:hypothetical protein
MLLQFPTANVAVNASAKRQHTLILPPEGPLGPLLNE